MQRHLKKYSLLLICCLALTSCSKNNNQAELSITIKDLTSPVITVKKKSYSITEGDSFKIEDCYKVSDNLTKEPTVELDDGGFNAKKAGTYTIKITAIDNDGNETEDSFKVEVKEKPKPTPTPTPTPKVTQESKANNNSNNSNTTNNSQSSNKQETVTQPVQPQQEQSSQNNNDETYTEPVTKTDGPYEDANACQMAARSHGALSYSCYDNNGQIYLEWEE